MLHRLRASVMMAPLQPLPVRHVPTSAEASGQAVASCALSPLRSGPGGSVGSIAAHALRVPSPSTGESGFQTSRSSVSCPSASQKPPCRASQLPRARRAWTNATRSAACAGGILTAAARCSRQNVLMKPDGQSPRTSSTRASCARVSITASSMAWPGGRGEMPPDRRATDGQPRLGRNGRLSYSGKDDSAFPRRGCPRQRTLPAPWPPSSPSPPRPQTPEPSTYSRTAAQGCGRPV